MKKNCLECGEAFNGRIDKKFCSDYCRNTYNNKINNDTHFIRCNFCPNCEQKSEPELYEERFVRIYKKRNNQKKINDNQLKLMI